jgi:hypothetical protein
MPPFDQHVDGCRLDDPTGDTSDEAGDVAASLRLVDGPPQPGTKGELDRVLVPADGPGLGDRAEGENELFAGRVQAAGRAVEPVEDIR